MGQYGNQPDFGAIAEVVNISGSASALDETYSFKPSALYIGTGGNLACRVVGGNAYLFDSENTQSGYTIFYNIPNGTFFPVIVDCVFAISDEDEAILTTCEDIIALR